MLFTYNPEFDSTRSLTRRRRPRIDMLASLKKKYRISEQRIVYLGGKYNNKTYASESIDLLRHFFEVYGDMKGKVVIRDDGRSMSEGLTQFGFKEDIILPSVVHHYLSVNDNDVHGLAKTRWRNTKGIDFTDDLMSSLTLLRELDSISAHHIRKLFDRNFMRRVERPSLDDALALIGPGEGTWSRWHFQKLREYRMFAGIDARNEKPTPQNPLWCSLDGLYWNT